MSKAYDTADRVSRIMSGAALWCSYYRSNPHRFARDYLHLELKTFQKFLLVMMNVSTTFVFIASRGLGKTFLSAIFCCIRCILYPGTKICIASGTRGQSINVLEKIQTELLPISPELKAEIEEIKINGTIAQILFKNGSFIKVVTASDNSRGNRANILLIDEYRMVAQDIIDTILRNFLTNPRSPKYLNNPKYAHLVERNKALYLSSGYYKDHWSYRKVTDSGKFLLDDKHNDFVCGFPYELAIQESLLMKEDVADKMAESDFNEIKWKMEMEAEFWGGDGEDSFFDFDSLSKSRRIQYPMLPLKLSSLVNSPKLRVPPKEAHEIRILSADIALMASTKHKNDATAVFLNQMKLSKSGRYVSNIVFGDSYEGLRTDDQALTIRKLYDEFECDYIVLDCAGLGLGVYDALAHDLTDPETGEIYPALSCCNNQEMADRCVVRDAEKVIWAIKANPALNSECALALRQGFRSGRIRLLQNELDAEMSLSEIKGFNSLSQTQKSKILLPYVHTTLLIGEMVDLLHEDAGRGVKIYERSGKRKDRYSSLSYNFYVANQIETKNSRRLGSGYSSDAFLFRAPKIKSNAGRW